MNSTQSFSISISVSSTVQIPRWLTSDLLRGLCLTDAVYGRDRQTGSVQVFINYAEGRPLKAKVVSEQTLTLSS